MKDDILGNLEEDVSSPGTFKGKLTREGMEIDLDLDPESGELTECLNLARAAVAQLKELDQIARKAAARELLTTYNESWREYIKGDGVEISNPDITEEEFVSRIALRSISFKAGELCQFMYHDDDLFAGHTIFVTSFDGLGFSDFYVELFG